MAWPHVGTRAAHTHVAQTSTLNQQMHLGAAMQASMQLAGGMRGCFAQRQHVSQPRLLTAPAACAPAAPAFPPAATAAPLASAAALPTASMASGRQQWQQQQRWRGGRSRRRASRLAPVQATGGGQVTEYTLDSLDFYAILGVMPHADQRTIRQAYLSLMRDLHPDRAAARSSSSSSSSCRTSASSSSSGDMGGNGGNSTGTTSTSAGSASISSNAGSSSSSSKSSSSTTNPTSSVGRGSDGGSSTAAGNYSGGSRQEVDGDANSPDEVLAAANELCALINEVYDVLKDEERRAKYDALSGFALKSLNPFLDTSFARDQLFVDELSCIGCGKCVRWAPGTFEIEASKYGRARVIDQSGNTPDEVQIAIETCPVDCIHYVTLPQLSLLESVLATMARIDVAVMQRTKRSPGNVFQEAYKAYERRQAAISAMRGGKGRPKIDWDFWGTGSLEKEEREEAEKVSVSDPTARRIARLAASAARAARMWRAYLKSRASLRTLTDGSVDG